MNTVDSSRDWLQHKRQLAWASTIPYSQQTQNFPTVPVTSIRSSSKPIIHSALPITKAGSSWAEKAHEYSQNSSLHGLRYIGDTRLHYLERLFWIISFCMAVIAAGYFITNIFQKWTETPVIMSLSPTATALRAIPFPAVTICNMNNARRSVAERILEEAKENPNDGAAKLDETLLYERCNHEAPDEDENRTGDWNYVKKFMIRVSQPCTDMLVACFWHKDPRNCYELFHPTLTDEGICCSFNKIKREFIFNNPSYVFSRRELSDLNVTLRFPSSDWNPETGYSPGTSFDHLPWRPWGTGSHLGLTLVIDAEQDEYYCSSEASLGFKILLHNPVETPKMSAFGSAISPGKETRFVINPHIITSTPQLADISVEKRNCYFNSERRLRFYRFYTERNCIVECEANFTLQLCNCVMYYMPKDKFTRICGKRDVDCAFNAKQIMEKILAERTLNITLPKNLKYKCGCIPSCFDLDFSKVQSTSLLTERVNASEYLAGRDPHYFKKNMAVLHMFFTEAQFTGIQRGVLFGFTEFLSSTGGLLGLFMGFSFLSAVEAFYFLSLRIWCSVNRSKRVDNTILPFRKQKKHSKALIPFMK